MIRFLVAFPNFGEVNIIIKDTAGFVCIVLGDWENRLLHFLGRLFEPFFFPRLYIYGKRQKRQWDDLLNTQTRFLLPLR